MRKELKMISVNGRRLVLVIFAFWSLPPAFGQQQNPCLCSHYCKADSQLCADATVSQPSDTLCFQAVFTFVPKYNVGNDSVDIYWPLFVAAHETYAFTARETGERIFADTLQKNNSEWTIEGKTTKETFSRMHEDSLFSDFYACATALNPFCPCDTYCKIDGHLCEMVAEAADTDTLCVAAFFMYGWPYKPHQDPAHYWPLFVAAHKKYPFFSCNNGERLYVDSVYDYSPSSRLGKDWMINGKTTKETFVQLHEDTLFQFFTECSKTLAPIPRPSKRPAKNGEIGGARRWYSVRGRLIKNEHGGGATKENSVRVLVNANGQRRVFIGK